LAFWTGQNDFKHERESLLLPGFAQSEAKTINQGNSEFIIIAVHKSIDHWKGIEFIGVQHMDHALREGENMV
jgi:hypothetical protein